MLRSEEASAVTVDPKYLRAPEESNRYLTAEVDGDDMNIRAWWDADDDGDSVIFQRVSVYKDHPVPRRRLEPQVVH
jgi:hypothetical protein